MNQSSCFKHNLYNCSYCHTTKNVKKMCKLHGIEKCRNKTCYTPMKERILNDILWLLVKKMDIH